MDRDSGGPALSTSPFGNNRTTVVTHTLDLSRWRQPGYWLDLCEVSLWELPVRVVASTPTEKLGTVHTLQLEAIPDDARIELAMALIRQASLLRIVIAIALHRPDLHPRRYLPDARFLLRNTEGRIKLANGKTLTYSSLLGPLPEPNPLSLYCVVPTCSNQIPQNRRPANLHDHERAICRRCFRKYKRGKQIWDGTLMGFPRVPRTKR